MEIGTTKTTTIALCTMCSGAKTFKDLSAGLFVYVGVLRFI